jgi:hypothetical protein
VRLGEVALDLVVDELRCTVDVEPEVGVAGGPFRLVVELPRTFVGLVDARASAFGPLAAAVCGEPAPMAEEGSVAPVAGWLGLAYDASAEAAATLVDPPGPVTHLLTVADPGTGMDERLRGIAALAEQRGLGFLPVTTNAFALASERGRSVQIGAARWPALARVLPAFSQIVVPSPSAHALAAVARDPLVRRHVVVCTEPPVWGESEVQRTDAMEAALGPSITRRRSAVVAQPARLPVEMSARMIEREPAP